MHERLARILTGERVEADAAPCLAYFEIAGLGDYFRRRVGWLGLCTDPREYAVELGLRVTCQPLAGSPDGSELVGNVILYRGDADARVWGGRVYVGLARALLRSLVGGHVRADRLRLIGECAAGELITGRMSVDQLVRAQVYCPGWLLRAQERFLRSVTRTTPLAEASTTAVA